MQVNDDEEISALKGVLKRLSEISVLLDRIAKDADNSEEEDVCTGRGEEGNTGAASESGAGKRDACGRQRPEAGNEIGPSEEPKDEGGDRGVPPEDDREGGEEGSDVSRNLQIIERIPKALRRFGSKKGAVEGEGKEPEDVTDAIRRIFETDRLRLRGESAGEEERPEGRSEKGRSSETPEVHEVHEVHEVTDVADVPAGTYVPPKNPWSSERRLHRNLLREGSDRLGMNMTDGWVDDVALGVIRDGDVMEAMSTWFSRDCSMSRWLRRKILDVAGCSGMRGVEDIKRVLKIHAIGDKVARLAAAKAIELDADESETNCYVEDGILYSNVWFRTLPDAYAGETAEELRRIYESAGFKAEIVRTYFPCERIVMAEAPYSREIEV